MPNFLSKVNMVDIAQLVSASDCGSEGRGFESHYPPQKKRTSPKGLVLFFWRPAIMEFERPLKKHAGGMFLGRGRIPGALTASRRGGGNAPALFPPDTQKGVFFLAIMGFESPAPAQPG